MSTDRLAELIGIPFADGGRDMSGCDCWGLAMLTARILFGRELPDYGISCFDSPAISRTIRRDRQLWTRIDRPEIGALVIMSTDPHAPDLITHIGTVVRPGRMLHTLKKQASHLERLDHPFYVRKLRGFYAR